MRFSIGGRKHRGGVRPAAGIALPCRIALIAALGLAGYGLAVAAWRFQGVTVVVLGIIAWRKLRRRTVTTVHGSARMATALEAQKAGLFADHGVLLGRALPEAVPLAEAAAALLSPAVSSAAACRAFFAATYSDRWQSDRLLRTSTSIHHAVFSPAGGGKNIGYVTPNMLSNPANTVILDPKGETFDAVSEHRRRRFGKTAYRLDPFGVCGPGGDTLNPFDWLVHTKASFIDDVRAFANPLIIREPGEKTPHFPDMAEMMLVALTAFSCCERPPRRHLGTVLGIASNRHIYLEAVEIMQKTDACGGVIKRLAGQLTFPAEEEQSSILSTFARQMAVFQSPLVAQNLAASSFDPMELKTGNCDVYCILPHQMLESHSKIMRLWLHTLMSRVTGGKPDETRLVHWILDEAAHIVKGMQVIENAVTLYRGYGMRMHFIFQSLGQLKTTFGDKAPTILDNIGTQLYVGINSVETAQELSKRMGSTTVATTSDNSSTSSSRSTGSGQQQGGNISNSSGVTHAEVARPLMFLDEILQAPADCMLIFHKNLPVLAALMIKSFEAPEFKNGGTASPRPLGMAAAMLAVLTLFLGLVISDAGVLVAGVPPLPRSQSPSRLQAMRRAGSPAYRRPSSGGKQSSRPQRRRKGPSGYLIKIDGPDVPGRLPVSRNPKGR